MSFDLICTSCGAPSGPSVGVCPFCKSVLTRASAPGPGSTELAVIEKAWAAGNLHDALAFATEAAAKPVFADQPAFLILHSKILLEVEAPSSQIRSSLAKALLLDPGNAEAAECMALINAKNQLANKENEAGERGLREVIKTNPRNATALFLLGAHLFWIRGQTDESRRLLEEAVRLRPDHLRAWGCLGELYRRLGAREDAARAFSRCVALETDPAMRKFFEERRSG